MKCLSPVYSSINHRYVPCGQCYYCRQRKRYEWSCRSIMERLTWEHGYFITLTYNNDNLPSDGGVSYEHADYFVDNLRKFFHQSDIGFSYYLMSEYGGKSLRPHYHMHLFTDASFDFVKKAVDRFWTKGFIKYGTSTLKSILYTSAFHLIPKEHNLPYPKKNFHIFTRGLGKSFVDKHKKYYLEHDRKHFEFGGFKFGLPPYIRDKFGFPHDDIMNLRIDDIQYEFYLGKIKSGVHDNLFVQWEQYKLNLNRKLIVNALKNKSKI